MPSKRNKENKGLPTGWRKLHGAYYYQVPKSLRKYWDDKQLFRLGTTTVEAYKTWSEKIGKLDNAKNIGKLLDRYAAEVLPTKAPKTRIEQIRQIDKVRAVFGSMPLEAIEPFDVYKYFDKHKAKVSAKRELAILSHAFTKAVEWGYIRKHPFKGEVRLHGEKPRTRYIEDWEIIECMHLSSVRKSGSIQAILSYVRIKLLTGLRRGDMLRLRLSDCKDDGICVKTAKTGNPVVYEWSEELRKAIALAKAARPVDISPYLFCNRYGKCYIDENGNASSWDSMWQRFMARVLKETNVSERFTEHDLRAKCASDASSLEHARSLLAHADSRITQRVYRRKPERVKPLK